MNQIKFSVPVTIEVKELLAGEQQLVAKMRPHAQVEALDTAFGTDMALEEDPAFEAKVREAVASRVVGYAFVPFNFLEGFRKQLVFSYWEEVAVMTDADNEGFDVVLARKA